MSSRLDLRPLLTGAAQGLRKRRAHGDEPPDKMTRWVLFGGALAAGLLIVGFRVVLTDPATLAEGAGVLVGALLAGFAMVAVWRDRLVGRARDTEQVQTRALDEAAAHILIAVLMAMLVTLSLGAVANFGVRPGETGVAMWCAVILGGVGIASLTYIAISLVIVVNLLWDAYQIAGADRRARH